MLAFKIVRHAVLMVLQNLLDIFRIVGPMLASIVLAAVLVLGAGFLGNGGITTPPSAALIIILTLTVLGATLWSYVAWHRFILLEERPKAFWMPVPVSNVFHYFGYLLLICLIGLMLGLPFLIIFAGVGGAQAIPVLGYVAFALGYLVVVTVITRLSILMPAIAIGQPIGIGKLWLETAGSFTTILQCVLLYGLLSIAVSAIFAGLGSLPVIGLVFTILGVVANLLVGFVGLSLLTTLYGYYVENRELM